MGRLIQWMVVIIIVVPVVVIFIALLHRHPQEMVALMNANRGTMISVMSIILLIMLIPDRWLGH